MTTSHRFAGVHPVDPENPYGEDAKYQSHCECGWVSEPVDKDEAWESAARHFLGMVKIPGLSGGSCRE